MIYKPTKPMQCMLLLIGSCAIGSSTTFAQVTITRDDNANATIEMTVSSAAQPSPVFKHRLAWLPNETTAGNAASGYLQSFAENALVYDWKRAETAMGEDFEKWQNGEPLPLDSLRKASKCFDAFIRQHIEPASMRRNCDWGFELEDRKGTDFYLLPLNGLPNTRSIARALRLQTKLAILESRFDDAIHLMKMNYQLAQHVGQVKSLVAGLVSFAEVGITNGNMEDLIAAPDSPNMYWALTELPRPFADLRGAFRMECNSQQQAFPALKDVESESHSPEEWARMVGDTFESVWALQMNDSRFLTEVKFAPAAIGVLSYGPAKKRLVTQGFDQAKVEAMPVGKVLLLDASREYQLRSNEMEKEIYLPFPIASKRIDAVERRLVENTLGSFGNILASMLLPAVQAVHSAEARTQRDIDVLRLIEALRMHAAEHGKFPASLDEISLVPVPVNPATGKPFEYRLEGATAIIELPRTDGIVYSKQYKITLR